MVTPIGELQIMTVGELLDALDGADRATHVVLAKEGGWYDNVGMVAVPGEDPETNEHMAVTIYPAGEMDPRQF